MRSAAPILLCIAAVSLLSCAHTPPAPPLLTEYGIPGAGKIQVVIDGDVKHPGKYWIPNTSNLVTVEKVFGGWGGHGDFGGVPPLRVILIRGVNEHEVRNKYSLNMPADQKAAITLEDGDKLLYPAILF